MKVCLFGLSCLLVVPTALNAAMTVQKKATRTKDEQTDLYLLFVDAATAGDKLVMRNLLDQGVLRDTQNYSGLLWDVYATFEQEIYAPYEVVMSVFELLEEYFELKEYTEKTSTQSHNDIDRTKLKQSIASLRTTLKQRRRAQQLVKAAKVGDAYLVKELLKKGVPLITCRWDRPGPFEWAAIFGHTEIMDSILDELENIIALTNT